MKAKIIDRTSQKNIRYCNIWSIMFLTFSAISCFLILINIIARLILRINGMEDNKAVILFSFILGIIATFISFLLYILMIFYAKKMRLKNIKGKCSIKAYSITILVLWCVGILLSIFGGFYITAYTYPTLFHATKWKDIFFQVLLALDGLCILGMMIFNFIIYYKK